MSEGIIPRKTPVTGKDYIMTNKEILQELIESIVALKMASIKVNQIIKNVEENIKILKPGK